MKVVYKYSIAVLCFLSIALENFGQKPLPGFWEDPFEMAAETDTVCGSEFEWNEKIYTKSGTYIDTILVNGFKTLVALHLILSNPKPSKTFVNVSAEELPYVWNGNAYAIPGTYSITYKNQYGCDSISYLYLHEVSECEPAMQIIHIDRF